METHQNTISLFNAQALLVNDTKLEDSQSKFSTSFEKTAESNLAVSSNQSKQPSGLLTNNTTTYYSHLFTIFHCLVRITR